jgi:predicted TIM-barrel fold metal-dependent hydrolase
MHEPLKRAIEYFGPERCAWGACFPNARWTKGTSYRQNLKLFTEELGLSQAEQEAILGTTALRLWFPGAASSG